jgi:NAD(P)-dependent dehydrogenase (short-subunit alcohol dehydrogenase family)
MPNDSGGFAGKVAFVTGAANGIGRAAALAFAREGVSLVVADILEQGNQETARMIEQIGGRALAVKCDVSRHHDVKAALEKTVETFGHLDFAFNNAGVEQPITPAADLTEEEWNRIVDINLRKEMSGARGRTALGTSGEEGSSPVMDEPGGGSSWGTGKRPARSFVPQEEPALVENE